MPDFIEQSKDGQDVPSQGLGPVVETSNGPGLEASHGPSLETSLGQLEVNAPQVGTNSLTKPTEPSLAATKAETALATAQLQSEGVIPVIEFAGTAKLRSESTTAVIEVAQISESAKQAIERLATADDRSTFTNFDALARRSRAPRLTDAQKLEYINLPAGQKEMFKATITELEKLADRKTKPSEYMTNTLKHAARLAEANGRASDSWNYLKTPATELFRDYVGMAFSERPGSVFRDTARTIAGSPLSLIGSALETTYQRLTQKPDAGDSFNPNILDIEPTNSVTHHYRELFVIGFNSGRYIADTATTHRDDARINPGDVRNGYFAAMVGSALRFGQITPTEAANLTEWAYTKHGGTQPPWGATHQPTKWLGRSEYDITKWMDAYRKVPKVP